MNNSLLSSMIEECNIKNNFYSDKLKAIEKEYVHYQELIKANNDIKEYLQKEFCDNINRKPQNNL